MRSGNLYVTTEHLLALRTAAEIDGKQCAEEVLEAILSAWLSARPEVSERIRLRDEARKAADKEWRAKYPQMQQNGAGTV